MNWNVKLLSLLMLLLSGSVFALDESLEITDFLPSGKAGLSEAGTLRIDCNVIEKNGIVSFKVAQGRKLKFSKGEKGFTWLDNSEGAATVKCLDYIEFPIQISNPGKYQVWYRAYFPFKGNWLHFESMDNGKKIKNVDNPNRADLVGKWVWVQGPEYQLSKGEHTWQLDGWKGGTSLDKVVFALDPKYRPEGNGPATTTRLAANKEFFISGEIAPGVKKWKNISWKFNKTGGVKCFISDDGACRWTPVKNGEDIGKAIKGKAVYVRFVLAADSETRSPIVQGVKLSYVPDPTLFKVLKNADMKMVFTPRGIREIVNLKSGVTFRVPQVSTEFFRVKVKKPGYNPQEELSSVKNGKCLELKVAGNSLKGKYSFLNGKLIVKPVVTLEKDGVSRWKLEVDNHSKLEVTEVQFPYIRSLQVGKTGADDILIINSVWGQIIHNPAKWKQKYATCPSLRFVDLYDKKGGIYIADHNTNFSSFNDIGTFVVPSEDGNSIDLNFSKYIRVAPGKSRVVDNLIVAVHGGDWHWGADLYRKEVVSKLKKPFYPEWVKNMDGWTCMNGFWPSYGFNVMQRYLDYARETGMMFMGGNRLAVSSPAYGYGGFYPYPTPVGGNLAEVKQYFKEIREEGGDTDFYIADNLHSPEQCKDGKIISGYAPKKWLENPKLYTYKFTRDNYAIPHAGKKIVFKGDMVGLRYHMCLDSKGWKDYLMYWTKEYVGNYKTYVYFDCTSCGSAYGEGSVCANLNHDHKDYGVYYHATTKFLEDTTKAAREIDPDYVCSGEGCNDMTGQSGILHMVSGVVIRNEIFRYTVPGQILLDGCWNHAIREKLGGWRRFNNIFMTGCRFNGLPDAPDNTSESAPKAYAQGLLKLRRQTKQYLYPARYMDVVGLTITDTKGRQVENPVIDRKKQIQNSAVTGLQAKWLVLDKGYEKLALVNIMNTEKLKGCSISLKSKLLPKVEKAWAFTFDGKVAPVAVKSIKDGISFPVPDSNLSTVLLVNHAYPQIRIGNGIGVIVTASGETVKPQIKIRNVEATPGAAELSWLLPDGCKAGKIDVVTLKPGEEKTLDVPFTVAEKLKKGRYNIYLKVGWRGKQDKIYQRLSIADPVLVRLRDDYQKNLELIFRNLTAKPQTVAGKVAVAAPLTVKDPNVKVVLKPHEVKKINIPVKGWSKVKLPLRAKANLNAAGVKVSKSLLMYPYIPNGDFESDDSGTLHPDWWAGWTWRGPADGYKFVHLDPKVKKSGKYSLRVDPYKDKRGYAFAQPMVCRLKANRKYKVSVDILRTKNNGAVYAQIQNRRLGNKNFKPGEWQHFETVIKYNNPIQFPNRKPGYDWIRWIRLINRSGAPAWFDNLKFEEIKYAD